MSCGRTLAVGRSGTRGEKTDVDLLRHLSERAHAERAPGQTLQSKLNELRREFEFAAPPFSGPTSGGAAIRAFSGGTP